MLAIVFLVFAKKEKKKTNATVKQIADDMKEIEDMLTKVEGP